MRRVLIKLTHHGDLQIQLLRQCFDYQPSVLDGRLHLVGGTEFGVLALVACNFCILFSTVFDVVGCGVPLLFIEIAQNDFVTRSYP